MSEYLNDNDKKAYAFIRNRLIHGGKSPTLKEINEVTGKSSPRSAVLVLERLEKANLVKRVGRKVKLVSPGLLDNASISTINIPLVGCIAAGSPMLAEENIEAVIPVSTALARPGSRYFLLRVNGDSMNRAGINDGNILLVRQQDAADNGQKVVALINDEATVKIFEKKDGMVILRPKSSNPDHKPIILTEECRIQGVVIATLPADLY